MNGKIIIAPLFVAALTACAASGPENPAAAENGDEPVFTAVSGEDLREVLLDAGHRVELGVDHVGAPMIGSASSGLDYQVLFYDCAEDGRCGSLLFRAGLASEDPPAREAVNNWNRAMRLSRAYITADGEAVVEMDLLIAGGVTRSLLAEAVKRWNAMLPLFADHLSESMEEPS